MVQIVGEVDQTLCICSIYVKVLQDSIMLTFVGFKK